MWFLIAIDLPFPYYPFEAISKRPLLPNICVRLKF
jgi:hypothetical protein